MKVTSVEHDDKEDNDKVVDLPKNKKSLINKNEKLKSEIDDLSSLCDGLDNYIEQLEDTKPSKLK